MGIRCYQAQASRQKVQIATDRRDAAPVQCLSTERKFLMPGGMNVLAMPDLILCWDSDV